MGLGGSLGREVAGFPSTADQLIDHYKPAVFVLEDFAGKGSRRVPRVQELMLGLRRLGLAQGLVVARYPRAAIRMAFSAEGARTKEELAAYYRCTVSGATSLRPAETQPWMSEDQRMAIFYAAALGLASCEARKEKRRIGS